MSKGLIYVFAIIGGIAGSFLFGLLDGGNLFGIWGIFGSLIGGLLGVYIGVRVQS